MKLLIFEFITGGGLASQALPKSLAHEGAMMLQALVKELKYLSNIQTLIMLDWRCTAIDLPTQAQLIIVEKDQDFFQILQDNINDCDAIWPIAPETDFILLKIAKLAETVQKTVLLSNSEAIALCGNKLATISYLQKHTIQVPDTQLLSEISNYPGKQSVIKPIDGVGCEQSFLVSCEDDFQQSISEISDFRRYIIQPYIGGQTLSLSCLFRHGRGWLICCNEQQVSVENGRFQLDACLVNCHQNSITKYQNLIQKIAKTIPGLWGYIGIDLIETEQPGTVVLEINPRLTTSYVGIRSATGINISEQVIRLLDSDPEINIKNSQQVNVVINKEMN